MTALCYKATRALVCSSGGVAPGIGLRRVLCSITAGDCRQFQEKNHREDYRDAFDAEGLPSGIADHHLPDRDLGNLAG